MEAKDFERAKVLECIIGDCQKIKQAMYRDMSIHVYPGVFSGLITTFTPETKMFKEFELFIEELQKKSEAELGSL